MSAQVAYDIGLLTHLRFDIADVDDVANTCSERENHLTNIEVSIIQGIQLSNSPPIFTATQPPVLLSSDCPEGYDIEDKTVSRQLET